MFKLKSKLIVVVMVMFGITAFMSCEKNDEISQEVNQKENLVEEIKLSNIELINKYKKETTNLKSIKQQNDQEIFMKYFSDYLILVDGVVYRIEDFLPIADLTEDDFYYMFIEKMVTLSETETLKSSMKKPPTREEIRNALMEECENYFLLEYACKAAVEIAYLLG